MIRKQANTDAIEDATNFCCKATQEVLEQIKIIRAKQKEEKQKEEQNKAEQTSNEKIKETKNI